MQWNEALRDVLNGKLKIVQNKRTESDSESEEGEIEDVESDFENHDTSERDGCYRLITTSPEDELNFHTDGELNTGEIKTEIIKPDKSYKRSNCVSKQPSRHGGGLHIPKSFGYELIDLTCYR